MPNYTTSYSTKNKPRYRKTTNGRLPGARKPPRRKDAQYLRRTQGFGGRRRSGHGYGGDDRRSYALIVVGCAFLLFVASIVWYANRSVEITLNGEAAKVRIHSSIERVIGEKELEPRPGNLLAVDDSVLEKGGGTACTVKLDGKIIDNDRLAEVELTGGEKLEVGDGKDVYEKHDVEATVIEPTLAIDGTGPLRFVRTWGVPGRSEVWTGKKTGIVADKGVVEDVVNAEVACTTVTPDTKGKKYVALTFDEGPSSRTTEILDILKEKDAKATFFVSGDKVAVAPTTVKAIVESGNELGTNAYSDINLGDLSASDLRAQLSDSFSAVKKAGGGGIALVRPPFGEFSEQNWADAMDMVSAVVSWNVDSGDWLLPGATAVADTVVGSVRNGSIVLLTDNEATCTQTVEALPQIIDRLRAEGYEPVSLSEMVATDDDLKDLVNLSKVKMPKKASLPVVQKDSNQGE